MSTGGREEEASGRLALVALTLVALVLRLYHLERFELWADEAATWWYASRIWDGGWAMLASQEQTPPLYYGLVGLFTRCLGEADWVLRLPSVVAGTLTVPVLFDLGRRVANRRVGWIAALLLTLHPLHIFYSREARVYALLLLLAVAMFGAIWRALESNGWAPWVPVGVLVLLVCSLHVTGVFLALTAVVLTLGLARRQEIRWRGVGILALVGLALVPNLGYWLPSLDDTRGAEWVETMEREVPEDVRLGRSLEMQLIGADYFVYLRQMDRPPTPSLLRWWALLANLLLIGVALLPLRRPDTSLFLGIAWLLPVIVPWTLSRLWQPFFHPGRHDVYVLGLAMLLVAVGVDRVLQWEVPASRSWRRPLLGFCLLGLLAGGGFRLMALESQPASDAGRAKGRWLASHAEPDDLVVTLGILRPVVQHYARLGGNEVAFRSFPASIDEHLGWTNDRVLLEDPVALRREAQEIAGSNVSSSMNKSLIEDDGERSPRVHVVMRGYRRQGEAVSAAWLVDHHLLESLRDAGWRLQPDAEAEQLSIATWHPPHEVAP